VVAIEVGKVIKDCPNDSKLKGSEFFPTAKPFMWYVGEVSLYTKFKTSFLDVTWSEKENDIGIQESFG
jgi:hypothetical protein